MSESEKIVLLSKLFFFTKDNKLIKENLWIADMFFKENIILVIVAQEPTIQILKSTIPKEYNKRIIFMNRSVGSKKVVKETKEEGSIFGMMGVVKEDAIFAFNCKIPLFNSEKVYSGSVDISKKVKNYGLPIIEFQNIIDCFKSYEIYKGGYFHISFGEKYSVISLNNANTYRKQEEEVRIKEIFETNLKGDKATRKQRTLLLLLFQLMNEVTSNKDFEEVDYWETFPSSDPDNSETSISFLKEAVRMIVNGEPKTGPEILIRKSSMQAKHNSEGQFRLTNKSNKDLDTLIVNPTLIKKIKGKVICIIDDYITNGYSAEAAKHLLLVSGAKKVIFISIGKFGRKYYSTNYCIQGDTSESYSYKFLNEVCYNEAKFYNANSDLDILHFSNLV